MTPVRVRLDRADRAILQAVRDCTGLSPCGARLVHARTFLPVREVLVRAQVLVWVGLLCALDGEPWAITPAAIPLTRRS